MPSHTLLAPRATLTFIIISAHLGPQLIEFILSDCVFCQNTFHCTAGISSIFSYRQFETKLVPLCEIIDEMVDFTEIRMSRSTYYLLVEDTIHALNPF